MKKNYLINTSNLHVGGAVAVATSFISEITNMSVDLGNISLIASSQVDRNLQSLKINCTLFKSYKVVDFYGLNALWKGLDKFLQGYDVVFTLFGPVYSWRTQEKHIVGFAQPWIIYPSNEVNNRLSTLQNIKLRLKYFIHSLFFSRADELIVELEHVKKRLQNYSYLRNIPTTVVHSTFDSIFLDKSKWLPVEMPIKTKSIKLGVISRNYLHKNLDTFPKIKKILKDKYNLDVEFFVTFPTPEWNLCSNEFKHEINNVGTLNLNQCPSFYEELDAIVFPSLLECFSAIPLEAMIMKKPLFASDLPFIKDCCGDNAIYFDPINEFDIAEKISSYFTLGINYNIKLDNSYKYAKSFSSSNGRAQAYLNLLTNNVSSNKNLM